MGKTVKHIIQDIDIVKVIGDLEFSINQLYFDSRKVEVGSMFVAVRGTQSDGHKFIDSAISKGAACIVCEELPKVISENHIYVQVKNSAMALGQMASNFFDNPSSKLKLVGITGTNGKTTTVSLLHSLFTELGYQVGMLSTIKNLIGNTEIKATHTTPDAIQLNELLAQMVEEGCEYAFMEVSSHAIDQGRINGLNFTGAIFSNLTHDHLDYHKTFDAYLKAKKAYFDHLDKKAFALINTDDKNGRIMVQNTKATIKTYSVKSLADYKCKVIEPHFDGMLLNIQGKEVWTSFIGLFNAYNLTAVFGAACELGANPDEVLTVLSKLKTVSGRFETIRSGNGIIAIVDYAHTPDALKNVLEAINKIRNGNETLITVVGAGGDRDPSKRSAMAKIVAELSNKVVFTSDNPRTEDPQLILSELQKGVPVDKQKNILTIESRRDAIKTALMLAQSGDIVLIAGKGHETYQEIQGVRHHFDDREVVNEIFENK